MRRVGSLSLLRAMLAVGAVVALSACSTDADSSELRVEQPRVGAAPMGADAALYLDLRSPVDDRLVAVSSPAAELVSLHQTIERNGGEVMIEVDSFVLGAGQTVELDPFGDHVMLEDLRHDLAPGDEVDVTLAFEVHDPISVVAEVRQLFDLAWEDA